MYTYIYIYIYTHINNNHYDYHYTHARVPRRVLPGDPEVDVAPDDCRPPGSMIYYDAR